MQQLQAKQLTIISEMVAIEAIASETIAIDPCWLLNAYHLIE